MDFSRRTVLLSTLAAGVMSGRAGHALGRFGPTEMHGHHHAGGCAICQSMQSGTLFDGPAYRPKSEVRGLLYAQSATSQTDASTEVPDGKIIVVQPSWVMVPEGDGLTFLADHDVVVEGDRIAEVRPRKATRDQTVDAAGQVLFPGFISGHSHAAAGTLTRGWIEQNSRIDPSAPSRSFFRAMALIDTLSDDELDDLTALNVAEMVRSGCTTQVEMSLSIKQVKSYVRVAQKYGFRGYGGGMVPGMSRLSPIWNRGVGNQNVLEEADADTLAEIQENLEFAKTVNGSSDGRIMMMMAPSVTPVFTKTSYDAIRDAVIELGTATHVHVQAGTRPQHIAVLREQWGMGELELLLDRGLLDQPLFGAHCMGLDNLPEDLKIMAHPNFTFVHCPSAGGAGQSPSQQIYPEALAANVNTSIGFDTHSNDYIENIKQATIQGRARTSLLHETSSVPMKDPTVWDALNSATLAGARGLERADLGRIEAGAKADLNTVDVSGLLVGNGIAPREPWNNLLYANGLSVRNVMIDGVWKVRDGALLFVNENELRERGGAAAEKIWDKMESEGFFVEMPK